MYHPMATTSSVFTSRNLKDYPWILDAIKQVYTNDKPINNQLLNTQYICKIVNVNYKSLTNTPYKFGIEMTLCDSQHQIPAYIKITDAADTLKYKKNQYLDLKDFTFQFDHKSDNMHILILRSTLCTQHIGFDSKNNSIISSIDTQQQIKAVLKQRTIPVICKTVPKSVDLFFPYPVFKTPTYSLITDINYDQEEKQDGIIPRKKQKLNQNDKEFNHILVNDQIVQQMLQHPLYFGSLCVHENNSNNNSNINNPQFLYGQQNKNAFADDNTYCNMNDTDTIFAGFNDEFKDDIYWYSPVPPMPTHSEDKYPEFENIKI
eukprot:552078_1